MTTKPLVSNDPIEDDFIGGPPRAPLPPAAPLGHDTASYNEALTSLDPGLRRLFAAYMACSSTNRAELVALAEQRAGWW